jgi:hypothetical protein
VISGGSAARVLVSTSSSIMVVLGTIRRCTMVTST